MQHNTLRYRDVRYVLNNLLAQALWGFSGGARVTVTWLYVGKMDAHRF